MEGITHLINGFITFFSVKYLLACFTGIFMGTIVGVLPGVGPTATMTLMLPFTFAFGPSVGLITLTGVLCGAMYGGSTTSILVNMPGEAASVVTCIDGYQMAKKGRGGAALALVAIGSFVAGTLGIVGLQIFAPFLGKVALSFGSPEYFSFMILAFVLISNLAGGSPLKSFIMLGLGLWLSSIGVSPLDNVARFTFGANELMLGIEFVPLAVGLFGLTEIISLGIEKYVRPVVRGIRLRELYPNREEIRRSIGPMFRGSILGFFIGLLPGPSAVISSFVSYSLEKKVAKNPDEFGNGAVEGVVGPESANNSAAIATLIPLLTLGIPFGPSSAVLLAGLLMHNVEPGPMLFQNAPEIFWTLIAALYIGNVMLLALNLPFVGFLAKIAAIRPRALDAVHQHDLSLGRLQRPQQFLRRLGDGPLRGGGCRLQKAEVPGHPPDHRAHPRADDRKQPAQDAHALPGGPDEISGQAHRPGISRRCCRDPRSQARLPEKTGGRADGEMDGGVTNNSP